MLVENERQPLGDPTIIKPKGDYDPQTDLYDTYETTPEWHVGRRARVLREQAGWS